MEGKHIKVAFTESVNMTILERVQSLLPFLDEAYEFLHEWTNCTPYGGDAIEIKYDKSFFEKKPEKIIGYSGNPIHIKIYPSGNIEDDLYIYFHELSHDFTPPNIWNIFDTTESLTEGIADLGTVFLYSRYNDSFHDKGVILEGSFLDYLMEYEESQSPFMAVRWLEAHPDGEHPSDRIAAGILVAIARRYGWQTFTRLFNLTAERESSEIFDAPFSFEAKMNSLVYLLSLSTDVNLSSLFQFWGFPLDADSDDDGLTDAEEIAYGLPIPDTDRDGLDDGQEIELGTNPNNPDTDRDGLDDGQEIEVGTNFLSNDSDRDGVTDYDEVTIFETNPKSRDTDNDLWDDYTETSIVREIERSVPFLTSIASSLPSNWWLPNLLIVFFVFIVLFAVVARARAN